ncbi:Pseudouridine-5'-phosphatase [Blyttiomyces sp. JEL0837]|nr:Pseudouridine-5'-phosphatase [Blyttiomyces sp. JEL0837]
MDGLLLDTERVYTEVTQEILSRFGKTFEWHVKAQMMGTKERDAAEILIKHYQIPMTADEYLAERNAGHESKFPHCKPLPGVMKLVSHLKKHGIPIGVATSSHRKAFNLKTQNNAELFSQFDYILCGDDIPHMRGKPNPDLFLMCSSKMGFELTETDRILVFEDAPSGVQAALNARMNVVWIPDVNLERDPQLVERCAGVYNSMEEFVPEQFGLPPYDN